jgi:hypothetical protein
MFLLYGVEVAGQVHDPSGRDLTGLQRRVGHSVELEYGLVLEEIAARLIKGLYEFERGKSRSCC